MKGMNWDHFLNRLGEALRDEESRRNLRVVIGRWIRRAFLVITVGYALALAGLVGGMRWIGEQHMTLGFLLYLPRQTFLLPLPFIMVLTLFFDWKLVGLQIAAGAAFVAFGMEWQGRSVNVWKGTVEEGIFTVLTYNRGQHANQSLQPFKNLTKPDFIVFQEAPLRAQRYGKAEGYEEFTSHVSLGEFTLLSRFPIISATPVMAKTAERERMVAVRYVVDLGGRHAAIYSVHFASPRRTLGSYARGGFLYGVIGLPGTPFNEKRKKSQLWWDDRIEQARELLLMIEQESLPVILAGDLNAPSGGYIHQLFKSTLRDAHAEAGSGFGFTFPGATHNPLSGGGPWMRIDYVFCSSRWEPVACLTEEERPSQHRAVAVKFKWMDVQSPPAESSGGLPLTGQGP